MGFEAFRVELRGGRATSWTAYETVRQFAQTQPDPYSLPTEGATYYLVQDGRHVLEVEIADSPVKVSCRFTLCHPPSVVPFFLGLVRELMARLGMEAKICDDVRPEHSGAFSFEEFPAFSAAASGCIAVRRAEWVAAFGDEPMASTTKEVYERVILPQCQPGAPQPT
jgi:hypothetical protein